MIRYARTKESLEESRTSRLSWAIGSTAHDLVERHKKETGGYLDYEHGMLNLISVIPSAAEAIDAIGDDNHQDREDIRQAKQALIRLNHAIRTIIDGSPRMTRPQLLSKIREAAVSMVPIEQSKRFMNEVRMRIYGMQQEIFTEQALWSIDGVDVDEEVSIEDDLHGVDIRFKYNGRPFALDVKSHEPEPGIRRPDDSIRFWTGLYGDELGERFRADDEQIVVIRNRLLAIIDPDAASINRAS